MAKVDILDIMRCKQSDPFEFEFDQLCIPNMYYYLTPQDIEGLRQIATSPRLHGKIDKKYELIDNIMRNRGFKRFSAGTNRVVYRFLEDTRFLAKIAVDKVGMQDNPMEFKNQFLLKPFVTKMFQVSPCGTVGFSERVLPIKRKEEFREIASDVFDILVYKILGKYVVEDVGTKYFMNWGVRTGFGPVLLDYPYVYELDGNKLYCTKPDEFTGAPCSGEIDYDIGFNNLVCTKCGKIYLATDLRSDKKYHEIVIRGGNEMKVVVKNNGKIVYQSNDVDEFIIEPEKKKVHGSINDDFTAVVKNNGVPINLEGKTSSEVATNPEPEAKADEEPVIANEDPKTIPIIEPPVKPSTDKNYEYTFNRWESDIEEINKGIAEYAPENSENKPITDEDIHRIVPIFPDPAEAPYKDAEDSNPEPIPEPEIKPDPAPKKEYLPKDQNVMVYSCVGENANNDTAMMEAIRKASASLFLTKESTINNNGGKKGKKKRSGSTTILSNSN